MKELSLNVLDIVQNSISAGASNIEISLVEDNDKLLTLTITDDGRGMSKETVFKVTNPFYTTRTTRKVGMGIPILKLAAEQAGGKFEISSVMEEQDKFNHGTCVTATFHTDNIDFTPIGDIVSTICVIIQGHPEIDYIFLHETPEKKVFLDTREMRKVLGKDISLGEPEIIQWLSDNLNEQYSQ